MRRWLGVLAGCAAFLALSATGCHHTAGVCDCDPGCDRCSLLGHPTYDHLHLSSGGHAPIGAAPVEVAPAPAKEELKVIPK